MQADPASPPFAPPAEDQEQEDNATPAAEREVVGAAVGALNEENVDDHLEEAAASGSNAPAPEPLQGEALPTGSISRRPVRAKKGQPAKKASDWEGSEGEEDYLQALGDLAAYDEEQEDPDHLDTRE